MALLSIAAPGVSGSDCPPIILRLQEYAACQDPETRRTNLALLGDQGAFEAPFNNEYLPVDLAIFGDGAIKTAKFQVLKRLCEDDLDDCDTVDSCAAGTEDPYEEISVDLDLVCTTKKITFTPAEYERVCNETVDTTQSRRIMHTMDALNRSHEKKVLAQMIAGAGGNVVGPVAAGGYKTLANTLINSSGVIDQLALNELKKDLLQNEATDCMPIVLGGLMTSLVDIDTIRQVGCCSDIGVNQSEVADYLGWAHFKSKTVQDAFDTAGAANAENSVLIMHPGSVHHIEYYRYRNNAFVDGKNFGRIFNDPVTGISYDIKVHWDDCNERYIMTISKQSQAWTLPTDLYRGCDPLTNTNGIWLYDFTATTPVAP